MMYYNEDKNKAIRENKAIKDCRASFEEVLILMKRERASFEEVLKNFGIIELTRFEKLVLKSKMNDNYNKLNEDK